MGLIVPYRFLAAAKMIRGLRAPKSIIVKKQYVKDFDEAYGLNLTRVEIRGYTTSAKG